jgi:acyl-CoA thioesterase
MDIEVPDGWQQGRGAYGGLVVAFLIRAMEVADRPLRSLQADLCGPVQPGAAAIAVETLREGSRLTTVAARLVQGGEVQAHATAEFGRAREGAGDWQESRMPDVAAWSDVPAVPMDFAPTFAKHFEYRALRLPFDNKGAGALGWIRPREKRWQGAAHVAGVIDAWWPAAFGRLGERHPMATIAYMLQIVGGIDGLDPALPMLHVGRSEAAAGGYVLEARELWGIDGRLVAVNQQTMVLLG